MQSSITSFFVFFKTYMFRVQSIYVLKARAGRNIYVKVSFRRMLCLRYWTGNPFCRKCDRVYLFVYKNYLFDRYLYLMYLCSTRKTKSITIKK